MKNLNLIFLTHSKRIAIGVFILISLIITNQSTAGWETLNSMTNNTLWDIKFYDQNTGWITGENGLIQKTTNGGLNWTSQYSGTGNTLRRIKIKNADTLFISGHNGVILRTTNGGSNWVNFPAVGNFYGGMDIWQDSLVYCAGSSLRFAKTTNSGTNWTLGIIPGIPFDVYAVEVIDSSIIYITGSAISGIPRIFRSTNGGLNYTMVYTPTEPQFLGQAFNDIYFLNADTGFACTTNGWIVRTTNTGTTWDTTTLLSGNTLRKIEFLNADTGFVCGSTGSIFGTTNCGQSWMQMNAAVSQSFAGLALSGNYVYVTGQSGILMRSNIEIVPQVEITGAITGNGNYSNLSSAFNAINSSSQAGAVINITLHSSTLETGSGAVLNNGAWSGITISPKAGASVTVTGNVNFGSAVITFNGADNVILDGLNSGGSSLKIQCLGNPGVSGAAVIKFQNDATNNKVKRSTIAGSFSTDFTYPCANIIMGGNSTSAGNDNNVIDDCDIGPAQSTMTTVCAIYFLGTNNGAQDNNNDTIKNCRIYGYHYIYNSSVGIYVGSGNRNIIIKDNKLYQPATLNFFSYIVTHTAIYINNNASSGFEITGNTIGYSSPSQTGNYTIQADSYVTLFGIRFLGANNGIESIISNNTIGGIQGNGMIGMFNAIFIEGGMVSANQNTIGSLTQQSIVMNANNSYHLEFNAIKNTGSSNFTSNSNNIGGITLAQANTAYSYSFNGIWYSSGGNPIWYCNSNIIGGQAANSINITATNHFCILTGINGYSNSGGSPTGTFSLNTIRNMSTIRGAAYGISIFPGSSGVFTVNKNLIHSIRNEGLITTDNYVTGIRAGSFGLAGTFTSNFIHSLSMGSQTGNATGIHLESGNYVLTNNMIRLGINSAGLSEPVNHTIIGINENNGANSFYHNSIYIGGVANSGSANSYCLYSNEQVDTRKHVNNIYNNERSNSGATGKHYSARYFSNVNLTSDYNLFQASGNGGFIGSYGGADILSLSSWKSATLRDNNSITGDPVFVNPTGNSDSVNLHLNSLSPCESAGGLVGSVSMDFDNQVRASLTPVDIGADAGNFITLQSCEALNFDGVNDNVMIPASLSANLTSPSVTEFTIEYWFKGSNIQSAVRIQNGAGYIVAGWGTPGNQKHLISTEGGTAGINVGANVTDGNWHHVAMTWKKNTINGFRSYLDGVLIDQKTSSNINLPNLNTECYLGRFASGSEYTNGTLDEVRIWTRSLAQSEIAANMNTEISSGTGLIACYHFNQGVFPGNNSGITILKDTTSNNYNGSLSGFALSGSSSNWVRPGPVFNPPSLNLDLKVIPEGFYNSATGRLNMKDTVTAYLCSATTPYNVIDSAKAVIDSVTYSGSFTFTEAVPGNYYIKIKHRNCIETWSASPFSITAASGYDITDDSIKAFGNNLKQVNPSPARFAVYSGDVDHNGSISLTDIIDIYNDASGFQTGYKVTDITGDKIVNLNDLTLVYNNSAMFIHTVKP